MTNILLALFGKWQPDSINYRRVVDWKKVAIALFVLFVMAHGCTGH